MALVAALTLSSRALAQGTAFTYQGRLSDNARPANGSYDLSFSLFPSASGGSCVGAVLSFPATPVTNGIFSLALDFGQGSFNGQARWVELAVRTNGTGAFSTLAPRRQLLASPQAAYAATVAAAQAVPASAMARAMAPRLVAAANLHGWILFQRAQFREAREQF